MVVRYLQSKDVVAEPQANTRQCRENKQGCGIQAHHLVNDVYMYPDRVQLHVMWRETDRFLESLARDVRENKRVMEASQFCRWLNFSGFVKLLELNPQDAPLRVDGKGLQKKLNDLIYDCGELFRGGKHDPKYAASDIAEINRKLDDLTQRLSPPSSETTDAANAALHVIQGGVI